MYLLPRLFFHVINATIDVLWEVPYGKSVRIFERFLNVCKEENGGGGGIDEF